MASYSYLQADRITIMNGMLHDRWIAWVISATLFVSFALCVVSDLRFSASVNEAGVALPVSAGIMTMGVSWLLGHGLPEPPSLPYRPSSWFGTKQRLLSWTVKHTKLISIITQ